MELQFTVFLLVVCLRTFVGCSRRTTLCKTRPVMVPVSDLNGDVYTPQFVWVRRCTGKDQNSNVYEWKCAPNKTIDVSLKVLDIHGDEVVKGVEQHLSCKMKRCSKEILNCPVGTVYNDRFCRCDAACEKSGSATSPSTKPDSSGIGFVSSLSIKYLILALLGELTLIFGILCILVCHLRRRSKRNSSDSVTLSSLSSANTEDPLMPQTPHIVSYT